jgi:hypothetical protein
MIPRTLVMEDINDTDLQRLFLSLKIKIDSKNYTLSDRLFFVDEIDKLKILSKTYYNENKVTNKLGIYDNTDCLVINKKIFSSSKYKVDDENYYPLRNEKFPSPMYFRILNTIISTYDCQDWVNAYYAYIGDTSINLPPKKWLYKDDSLIKNTLEMFLECTKKDTLITTLPFILTDIIDNPDYTLNDILELKWLDDLVKANKFPKNIYGDEPGNGDSYGLLYIATANNDTLGISGNIFEENISDKATLGTDRLGFCKTIIYLFELLYLYYKKDDVSDGYFDVFKNIFSVGLDKCPFITKFVYDFNDNIEINENLQKCFVKDNELRYKMYQEYFYKIIEFLDDDTYVPYFMPILIDAVNEYALYQIRVKVALYLYNLAKAKGIDKDLNMSAGEDEEASLEDMGLTPFSKAVSESNELLNGLEETEYPETTEDTKDDKSLAYKEDKFKESLSFTDNVKTLLNGNRYTYNVKEIPNDSRYEKQYNDVKNTIKLITSNLIKEIKNIRTYNSGGKNSGQTVGKLDKKNLWKYKTDKNIFYNNNYKVKEMDLAFGLILDESGSMCGTKIVNGRIVMIMLHEVLQSLGINHSVIGHTAKGNYNCIINKYYKFKEEPGYSISTPVSLASIESKWGNCDSGALYYMETLMKGIANKDKIVIIFSDGEPTECTENDLRNQVRHMEHNGIHVIGVGINFSSIKSYYPDNANGKNLTDMVNIVVSILKRYVLEKKKD